MRHPTEGVLRRLLDEPAGVADADRQHVAGCPRVPRRAGRLPRGRRPGRRSADDRRRAGRRCRRRLAAPVGSCARGGTGPDCAAPVGTARASRSRAILRRPIVAAVAVAARRGRRGHRCRQRLAADLPDREGRRRSASAPSDLVALPDLSAYGELEVTGDPNVHNGRRTRRPRQRRPVSTCPEVDDPAARGHRRAGLPGGRQGERHLHLLGGARRAGSGRRRGRRCRLRRRASTAARCGWTPARAWPRSGRPPPGCRPWSSVAPSRRRRSPPASAFETVRDYLLSLPGLPDDVAAQLRTFTADGSHAAAARARRPGDHVVGAGGRRAGHGAGRRRDRTLAAVVWVEDGVVTVVAGSLDVDEVLSVARELR